MASRKPTPGSPQAELSAAKPWSMAKVGLKAHVFIPHVVYPDDVQTRCGIKTLPAGGFGLAADFRGRLCRHCVKQLPHALRQLKALEA